MSWTQPLKFETITNLCHICQNGRLVKIPEYRSLKKVTSDCRIWDGECDLAVCAECATVQKIVDQNYLRAIKDIYSDYHVYFQANGVEQAVFDDKSSLPSRRSAHLVEKLIDHVEIPHEGRLLDVGCGNGAFMSEFNKARPHWSMVGYELDESNRAHVEKIAGLESFVSAELENVNGIFDLIALIHCLEHIVHPTSYLGKLVDRLSLGGKLFIECPIFSSNVFDLIIVDHSTHFTSHSMEKLLNLAGLVPHYLTSEWIFKEMSIVARPSRGQITEMGHDATPAFEKVVELLARGISWLNGLVQAARDLTCRKRSFGIFGTSISGVWLFNNLEGACVDFFVDEDPHRVGLSILEKPILHPRDVQTGSTVFLPFPKTVSRTISQRLMRRGIEYHYYED